MRIPDLIADDGRDVTPAGRWVVIGCGVLVVLWVCILITAAVLLIGDLT